MYRTLRLLALLAALPLALAACNTGTKAGDTNVELATPKDRTSNHPGMNNADSLAAGIPRDTVNRPTGKELYQNANKAVDKNHDGIAD